MVHLYALSAPPLPTVSRLVLQSQSSHATLASVRIADRTRLSPSNWVRRQQKFFRGIGEVVIDALSGKRQRLRSIPPTSQSSCNSTREEHFEQLEKFYEENEYLFVEETWGLWGDGEGGTPLPDRVEEKYNLSLAAGRCTRLSRVLVGGGSPAFVQQLCHTSSPSALVVTHYSFGVLATIKEMNDDSVCWHGNIEDLPHSYGPFDAVFLNSLPVVAHSPACLLQMVGSLCNPGARIVISHCQGKEHLAVCEDRNPEILLHTVPDRAGLDYMINALPLKLTEFQDEPDFYLATLEVTTTSRSLDNPYDLDEASDSTAKEKATSYLKFPLRIGGHIVRGFNRGSKELGIPTANIDPLELSSDILDLPKGVYFGWAQVRADGFDTRVHKMVMNIGNRPTFEDDTVLTVELHILHYYEADFYGKEVRTVVLGFIRDEMKFNSPGDLVQRINTDIGLAETILDDDGEMLQFASDSYFDV